MLEEASAASDVAALAALASQHPQSQYNRAKYGEHGSPVPYAPLSLHLPEQFRQLRIRQRLTSQAHPWSPALPTTPDHFFPHPTLPDHPPPAAPNPALKNSVSHPINISTIVPPDLIALVASHALLSPPDRPTILDLPPLFSLSHLSTFPESTSTLLVGNFYLSSCPGKKGLFRSPSLPSCAQTSTVRLDGPVKGRNGVCRDLDTDMRRMRALGVRCIVCCLDDAELEFLGVPWQEYEHAAKRIGLDVLRLPIPEGLPPLSPASLDVHLVDLIHRYTLQGFPILAHCRGGVGRAGLIACCWMIRLGLCGSTIPPQSEHGLGNSSQQVLSFVETAINIVRERRSLKAIETYEQVKFLVDYVEFLWYGVPTPQEIYTPV
ncbi:hypothetical protein JR316_0002202 [Psilocybe cubensis]|uniref:Uncharacterized protein n=2 Tax=Psilocybe cubensis TaxID=181762 RepID=A0ACB8HC87_PSICU|nr:hypothetical protein JR316_0002202 [Psilocybe cubensis]KAH9485294.1 hypothetical protein JR316_0002202 [Psilocybe cubensis]